MLLPCGFTDILWTPNNTNKLLCVSTGSSYGYINLKGNYVINPQYDEARAFSSTDKLAAVCIDEKWGYINDKGELVIPAQFTSAYTFVNGYARVRIDGKYGLIDKKGNYVIPPEYEGLYGLSKAGILSYRDSEYKYGLINTNGQIISEASFNNLSTVYDDGFAVFEQDGKCGIINKKGEIIVPATFDNIAEYEY